MNRLHPINEHAFKQTEYIHLVSTLLFLALIMPFGIFYLSGSLLNDKSAYLLILSIIVGSATTFRLSDNAGPAEFTLLLYVYVFLCLAPLAQVASKTWPHYDYYHNTLILEAIFMVFLGLAATLFGGILITKPLNTVNTFSIAFSYFNTSKIRIFFLGALALTMSAYLFMRIGGFETVFMSRHDRFLQVYSIYQSESAMGSIFNWLLKTPPFIFLLFVFSLIKTTQISRHKYILWGVLIVLATWNLLLSNPVNSPRFWLGSIALAIMFYIGKNLWLQSRRTVFVVGVIAFLVAFSAMDAFRSEFSIDRMNNEISSVKSAKLLTQVDFDSFQQVVNAIVYSRGEEGVRPQQLLSWAFFWLPRSVWESKPESSGSITSEYRDYRNPNLSMPLWGEFFLAGGWLGLIFLSTIYGAIVRFLDLLYFNASHDNRDVILIFVSFFSASHIFLLRGPTIGAWPPIAMTLVWILLHSKLKLSAPK